MSRNIVDAITKGHNRKTLFHFTRASNLPAIAGLNTLFSSYELHPESAGERRIKAKNVDYGAHTMTINAHLRISGLVIDPATTLEQFRACLDRHVFFWPTLKDCRKMMGTYARREPGEEFAVLALDAHAVLTDHFSAVKLSKYDSGSSPRFPARCSYKKSPEMLLPLCRFGTVLNSLMPGKPSEIREVLIEGKVHNVTRYINAVYAGHSGNVPDPWGDMMQSYEDLLDSGSGR